MSLDKKISEPVPRPSLYHSPIGLYPFQVEGIVYAVEREDNLAVWDTGIGKSHLAMATAAILFEDDLIDHMILVCEKNKLDPFEWPADLEKFTDLDFVIYAGAVKKRKKLLGEDHQVYIGTYETFRNDITRSVRLPTLKNPKLVPHFFTEAMQGRRVLLVYDEMTKLGNRGSLLHKSHDLMVKTLRDAGGVRLLGLTATPIERSPENFYNLGRIFMPDHIGTVANFEADYVGHRDLFGTARSFKNLDAETTESGVVSFADRMKPIMLRKRKTDADVIDQFPQTVQEYTYLDLVDEQKNFYEAVDDALGKGNSPGSWIIKRQIAGHPSALLHSEGRVAQEIVEYIGANAIKAIPSIKAQRLVEYLQPLVKGQGAQAVVFSFFGPSILPYLRLALAEADITSSVHYGQMSDGEKEEAKRQFKTGKVEVLLTSDAGARGINLPEASYCVEYEMALTHAMSTQRLNRIHRIDSKHPSVTFQSFIVRGTVEEDIAAMNLTRNEWSDRLIDGDSPDEAFISATQRRRMMQVAKAV